MPKMSKKQITFCDVYADLYDIKEACLVADISESTANKYLKDPECMKYISSKNDRASEKYGVSKGYIIKKLKTMVERCMQEEPVMKFDNITKEYIPTGEYTFDAKNANKALELLARHIDMFDNPFDYVSGSERSAEEEPLSTKSVIIDDIPTSVDVDELKDKILSEEDFDDE